MSWWWQLVFDLIWQNAGTFGEINAWAFMDYLIMLYPWYDALADINMHLFACLVISSNIISTWLAGWLASSFLVLNGNGYVFLHLMAWNWPYFLVADFFDQLLTYHSLMRLHQHARFALVFLLLITWLSWSDLI